MDLSRDRLLRHHEDILSTWKDDSYQVILDELTKSEKIESFLDIGANTGAVVEVIHNLCSLKKVYCFEPLRENFSILQEKLSALKANDDELQVSSFERAIFYGAEKVSAYGVGDGNPGGMFLQNIAESFGSSSKYSSITPTGAVFECAKLEDYFLNDEFIDLCKIDIEGSEWNLFLNSTFIKNNVRNILLEYHWLSLQDTIDFCSKHLPMFDIIRESKHDCLWLRRN